MISAASACHSRWLRRLVKWRSWCTPYHSPTTGYEAVSRHTCPATV